MGLYIDTAPRSNRGATAPARANIGDTWEETIGSSSFRWYWSGSYWLSQQVLEFKVDSRATATTTFFEGLLPGADIFLLRQTVYSFISTPFGSRQYWRVNLQRSNAVSAATTIQQITLNPDTSTTNSWNQQETLLSVQIDTLATNAKFIQYTLERVGVPGVIHVVACLKYRLVKRV